MLFPLFSLTPNALEDEEAPLIGIHSLTWNSFAPMSLTPHSMIRKSFHLYPNLPDAMAGQTDEVKDFTEIALDALPLRLCVSWEEFWPFPDFVIPYTLATKESWTVIPIGGQIAGNLTCVSTVSAPLETIAFQPPVLEMMTVNVSHSKRTSVEATTTGGFIQGISEDAYSALSESSFDRDAVPNIIMSTPKIVQREKAETFTFNFISSKAEPISKTAATVGNIHVVGFPPESLTQPTHARRLPSHLQNSYFAFPARSKDLPPKWELLRSPDHGDDPNSFAPGIRHRVLLTPTSQVNVFQEHSARHLGVIPNRSRDSPPSGRRILSGARLRRPYERPFSISPIGVRKPDFSVLTKNARKGMLALVKSRQQTPKCRPKPITESLPPIAQALSCVNPRRHRRFLETLATIDLDLIKPSLQIPWYVIREMRPNFIGQRRFLPEVKMLEMDPSIKAEQAIAYKAIFEELLRTVERIGHKRKGPITLARIPVIRETKFPKTLRKDADLIPFMLLATEAEQHSLETSKSPTKPDNLTT